jgi:hypothetical protein
MSSALFDAIDWQQPWLSHVRAIASLVLQEKDWCEALNRIATQQELRNQQGLPIKFVPQAALPLATAYETFINDTGCVPTRHNLHDFFNALVWLTFPKIKVQLNALQANAITRNLALQSEVVVGTPVRGKLRDAATIFDENAVLLITGNRVLVMALREHRWQEAFLACRASFGLDCEVRLFGHALMEKLVAPYKSITGHARLVVVDAAYFRLQSSERLAWIDAFVAADLQDGLTTSDFTPLPILGVPGWCAGQDEAFYQDATVFRPPRSERPGGSSTDRRAKME